MIFSKAFPLYIIIMKIDVASLIVTCVRIERSTLFQNESCIRTLRFFVDCSQSDYRKVVCKIFMRLIVGPKTFFAQVNSFLIINPIYG